MMMSDVTYQGNEYVVCRIENAHGPVLFVIDKINEERLTKEFLLQQNIMLNGRKLESRQIQANFILQTGKYIARNLSKNVNGRVQKSVLLLHNILKNRFTFDGKGQTETVDHKNRNGRDNRLSNLHITSQSLQNMNQQQKAKEQKSEFDFNANFIPKNIHFCGGRNNPTFEFHLKMEGKSYRFKKTLPSNVSLHMKLLYLIEILKLVRPILPDYIRFLPEHFVQAKLTEKDFNEILQLSNFDSNEIKNNLANNFQFVFATAEESLRIERQENIFYVLIPTNEEKQIIESWLTRDQTDINMILQNMTKIRDN